MGEAMRAAGIGPQITVDETVYHFKPFGPTEIGQFEAWLECKARDVVRRWRPELLPSEYDDAMRTVIAQCASDGYAWGSEPFATASASIAGMKKAVEISLKAGTGNPPEVDAEFVENLWERDGRADELRAALVAIGWVKLLVKSEAQ